MDLHALIQELIDIRMEVEHELQIAESSSARAILVSLEESAFEIGRAWSGSWIGDHANLYYKDFQPPPPDKEFDQQSGKFLRDQPAWIKYSEEEVQSRIHDSIDANKVERATGIAKSCQVTFESTKSDVLSILHIASSMNDSFINNILASIDRIEIPTVTLLLQKLAPQNVMTRDIDALSKRSRIPPHLTVFAETVRERHGIDYLQLLHENIRRAINHLKRVTSGGINVVRNGSKIFIGHGGSTAWEKLRDYLKDELTLEWDEFNRVPTAGTTIIERLERMLNDAQFAFLVMTAEDETAGGEMQARMNVIHEAGLFQGRLGFDKAIILLEDGCEEFSNKHGLIHISFSKGMIDTAFKEIRRVLEDRDIIPG